MRATLGWKDQVGNHEFREWDEWEAERGGTMGRGWVCGTCFAAGVRAHQGWCVGRPGWVYKHAKVERVGWGHCWRTGGGWGGGLGDRREIDGGRRRSWGVPFTAKRFRDINDIDITSAPIDWAGSLKNPNEKIANNLK